MTPQPARHLVLPVLLAACLAALPATASARVSSGAPHTGMESPDEPKRINGMPGASALTDAYGNSILDDTVPEKKPAKRLPPGAYGGYGKKTENRPLPETKDNTPLW